MGRPGIVSRSLPANRSEKKRLLISTCRWNQSSKKLMKASLNSRWSLTKDRQDRWTPIQRPSVSDVSGVSGVRDVRRGQGARVITCYTITGASRARPDQWSYQLVTESPWLRDFPQQQIGTRARPLATIALTVSCCVRECCKRCKGLKFKL